MIEMQPEFCHKSAHITSPANCRVQLLLLFTCLEGPTAKFSERLGCCFSKTTESALCAPISEFVVMNIYDSIFFSAEGASPWGQVTV